MLCRVLLVQIILLPHVELLTTDGVVFECGYSMNTAVIQAGLTN